MTTSTLHGFNFVVSIKTFENAAAYLLIAQAHLILTVIALFGKSTPDMPTPKPPSSVKYNLAI